MKFENSWVIAGVRGTSLAIQWDNITIYQSQGFGGFAKYGAPTADSQTTDLSKCSFFNTRTKNIEPLPPPYSINRYCLSGTNDTILDFTKKDLIYLNELIENNQPNQTILQEKNIIAPQQIQENQTFCPPTPNNSQQKTTFWPNVTDPNEMCQEQNVVAIATLTPKGGKIVYKKANGGIGEKKITIKQNPNNSDYYGGSLELNSDLTAVLNGSHLEMLKPPLFWASYWDVISLRWGGKTNFYRYPLVDQSSYNYNRVIDANEMFIMYFASDNNPFVTPVTLVFIKK